MVDIAVLVAIVVGLTELFKRVFGIKARFLPLISLIFGIVGGIIYLDGTTADTVLQGIVVGLSASGLYDQSKIIEKEDDSYE